MIHTPPPYTADGFDIYAWHPNGKRYQIAKAYSGWLAQPLSHTVRAEQQAEFIVTACNAYHRQCEVLRLSLLALNTAPRFKVRDTDSYAVAGVISAALGESHPLPQHAPPSGIVALLSEIVSLADDDLPTDEIEPTFRYCGELARQALRMLNAEPEQRS